MNINDNNDVNHILAILNKGIKFDKKTVDNVDNVDNEPSYLKITLDNNFSSVSFEDKSGQSDYAKNVVSSFANIMQSSGWVKASILEAFGDYYFKNQLSNEIIKNIPENIKVEIFNYFLRKNISPSFMKKETNLNFNN